MAAMMSATSSCGFAVLAMVPGAMYRSVSRPSPSTSGMTRPEGDGRRARMPSIRSSTASMACTADLPPSSAASVSGCIPKSQLPDTVTAQRTDADQRPRHPASASPTPPQRCRSPHGPIAHGGHRRVPSAHCLLPHADIPSIFHTLQGFSLMGSPAWSTVPPARSAAHGVAHNAASVRCPSTECRAAGTRISRGPFGLRTAR